MAERIVLKVSEEEVGQRLDVFLSSKVGQASRSNFRRWIDSGYVTVQGQVAKASHRVKRGEEIRVVPAPPKPLDLLPEPIPLKIIHEDDDLIVVDKSAGLVVHPGAGNWRGTLANALLYHFEQVSHSDGIRPGIVHRLDKETSGLLVIAKNELAHDFLATQFKQREVRKIYAALVYGKLEKKQGVVDIPLGRDHRSRTKISTNSRRARQAETRYKVIQVYSNFTYVEAVPRTGRTHQIRVHFQYLGHPVVGDDKYGKKALGNLKNLDLCLAIRDLGRHFLHAYQLSFIHPSTKKKVFFEAPLPEELMAFLSTLE